MASIEPKIVQGGGAFWVREKYDPTFLDVVEELGIKNIDTAAIYGDSEDVLGEANAPSRFVIDTKFPGGFGSEPSTKENIIKFGETSLKRLKTKTVSLRLHLLGWTFQAASANEIHAPQGRCVLFACT
jgi:aryl-alcohol dehydrogenase-like predicted oxidoreductase